MIIDNIISNSIKAGASVLRVTFGETNKTVEIAFSDNGIGLVKGVDVNRLFEYGYSSNATKSGFGIGLYHIKQLVTEMRGSVEIDDSFRDGFRLVVKLRK